MVTVKGKEYLSYSEQIVENTKAIKKSKYIVVYDNNVQSVRDEVYLEIEVPNIDNVNSFKLGYTIGGAIYNYSETLFSFNNQIIKGMYMGDESLNIDCAIYQGKLIVRFDGLIGAFEVTLLIEVLYD